MESKYCFVTLLHFCSFQSDPTFIHSLAISDQKKCIICLIFLFEQVFLLYFILAFFPSHVNLLLLYLSLLSYCKPLIFSTESFLLTFSNKSVCLNSCLFFKDDFAPNIVEDKAREDIRQNLENFIRQDFPGK